MTSCHAHTESPTPANATAPTTGSCCGHTGAAAASTPRANGDAGGYTCPMHPEVVRDGPGACPKCGMPLEPIEITAVAEADPELVDMQRRMWVSAAFTLPLLAIAMGAMLGIHLVPPAIRPWVELALATPVVLWGGWTFLARGWASMIYRHLNMFTLIAIGVGAAYLYSVVATVWPDLFPGGFRDDAGHVGVYFEAAAVIVTLVLLGQVLEGRARGRTTAAIRSLLEMAPHTPAAWTRTGSSGM